MEKTRFREEQHKMRSILAGKSLARRTGLLLTTVATVLMLASGVALANFVPCGVPGHHPVCGGVSQISSLAMVMM
jgi:hypothetical protein